MLVVVVLRTLACRQRQACPLALVCRHKLACPLAFAFRLLVVGSLVVALDDEPALDVVEKYHEVVIFQMWGILAADPLLWD